MKIKETIVVEGRDDVTALKNAVECSCIVVGGFAVSKKETIEKIVEAEKRTGIIIFTDPDYAGEKIRKTIEKYVKNPKHAYITRGEGTRKDGNVGVENANPKAIREALMEAKAKLVEGEVVEEVTITDMQEAQLTGSSKAKIRRDALGKILGIGYGNAKQFLSKVNHFGITKKEFLEGVHKLKDRE